MTREFGSHNSRAFENANDDTRRVFTSPREKLTEDYITGRFG